MTPTYTLGGVRTVMSSAK